MRMSRFALFQAYIAIDYSGAQTPTSSLPRLRVFEASATSAPTEVRPPSTAIDRPVHWTRRGLVGRLSEGRRTLVGINHPFSFPRRYFEVNGLMLDWPAFLDDFQHHWPTDEDGMSVELVRQGVFGDAAARRNSRRWQRLTESRARVGGPMSHPDAQIPLVLAAQAGLPWLRYLRRRLHDAVHFWPFDGWEPLAGRSVVAEVCPRFWQCAPGLDGRRHHGLGACSVAERMRSADADGHLLGSFMPRLDAADRATARIEGWILGVQ